MSCILTALAFVYLASFRLARPAAPAGDEGAKDAAKSRLDIRSLFEPYELPTRRRDLRDMASADLRWRLA